MKKDLLKAILNVIAILSAAMLAILALFSCNEPHIPVRPFVVTSKSFGFFDGQCSFTYTDSLGYENCFGDYCNVYHVGDTIK